jgi:stringent starvation protein B
VENGRIVFNIHPRAVQNYAQDDERLSFSARFGGAAHLIEVPMTAVLAIYARENGQGVSFPAAPEEPGGPDTEPPAGDSPPRGRPQLKVVK